MFSDTEGIVITGKQTDELPDSVRPQTFSGAWDPWYYLRAKEKGSSAKNSQLPSKRLCSATPIPVPLRPRRILGWK
ncbi:hypothetical protein FHL15_001613 [Xylaria flabelliformis]|uniref:Uncharacterized protein n=1 Tax=Xylaria flabelliformis TaxID=2512241 RepID=A0A553IAX0_9PEZI|nr:hypothetical protein FHL15_001613 [Xylaria flabelliformis]